MRFALARAGIGGRKLIGCNSRRRRRIKVVSNSPLLT
jgi:hypothetical protein